MFPAYSTATDEKKEQESKDFSWLTNPSYEKYETPSLSESSSKRINEESNEQNEDVEPSTSHSSRSHKKKHKKDRNHRSPKENPKNVDEVMEFDGTEDYYVDKSAERGYLRVETLHRPACPRYRVYYNSVVGKNRSQHFWKVRRYYLKSKKGKIEVGEWNKEEKLSEEDFSIKNKEFNRQLGENPGRIELWIQFIHHQDMSHMKSTKTQVVESKLDILNKALRENPKNEDLYKLYIQVIDRAYPSFEVSKILDQLLAKDLTNYTLWNAQILATQGSMARCIIPNVLKLYEQCMKNMYNKNRYDEVMLKLFTNCCLFLRQSGLYEQFFALIKLALELNVAENKFTKIQPSETDQNTLIEYEEVILQSGLPMNEIWLRIEKLRQNFYFLPCPENRSCSDPQRIVFNEDIVHFVYPLANRAYSFNLIVIVLKLLKVPMPGHSLRDCFFTKQEHCSEFDCIEDILSVLLYKHFVKCDTFEAVIYDFVKDFSIGPSYISSHIGYEIYFGVVLEYLRIASECYPEDLTRKNILVMLWLKFERILLIFDRIAGKVTDERAKQLRTKVKNLLKREENRNVLVFYGEYALIEYELGRMDSMENVFHTALGETRLSDNDCTRADFYATFVLFVEIMLRENKMEQATQALTCLGLDISLREFGKIEVTEPKKLQAMKKLSDRLKDLVFIERNVSLMELEQCFMSDYLVSLMKANIYFTYLIKSKQMAVDQVNIWMRTFVEINNRHSYIRENLHEILVNVLQLPSKSGLENNAKLFCAVESGLNEFPNNLLLLWNAATMEGQTWFKIRSLLTKSHSPVSTIFLVMSAKYRYIKYSHNCKDELIFSDLSSNVDNSETAYKTRVCNLLKSETSHSIARKNSLLWRVYLKSLLDIHKDFEKSRNTLFAALDECPWNKALYLDGTVYVPQELPHIQDLIIEKQLRIYALPEELEILRSDDVNITNR
ncbi:Nuclear exosome regulator NRDE2 [Pseudolycoriella hygida]|uniref:Nuclear exosome regulator NRDE2 n=1 Tax=Pseudolycoriella hygida TaxID=35572 RepID=A0A9Q0S879_9DIPT|nr:Nuclear exosome regulator NRDE2 [Pseudolycoriella hygida]